MRAPCCRALHELAATRPPAWLDHDSFFSLAPFGVSFDIHFVEYDFRQLAAVPGLARLDCFPSTLAVSVPPHMRWRSRVRGTTGEVICNGSTSKERGICSSLFTATRESWQQGDKKASRVPGGGGRRATTQPLNQRSNRLQSRLKGHSGEKVCENNFFFHFQMKRKKKKASALHHYDYR